jgi:hypothetical protein
MPREILWLSTIGPVGEVSKRFESVFFQDSDYLGVVLITFIWVFCRRYWRLRTGKLLILLLVAIVVAALGPSLHVGGNIGFPLPWVIVERLPLISVALPMRLMMYVFLVVALMAAIWFAEALVRSSTKIALAILILVSLAPNPKRGVWLSKLDLPAFFTERLYARELSPREIILPLPWGQKGNSMYWQSQSDMYFRMAGGYTGEFAPFEFARMPVANYFCGGIDLPEAGDQLKAYIARFGVQAVVVDPQEANFESFEPTFEALGVQRLDEKGVALYKIHRDSFSAYAQLPAAQVEARANALRFDAILEAAGKYLAARHDLSKLSPLELKRLDLLPHDWLVDAAPDAYKDWQIAPVPGTGVGIIIVGSYDGVRPLLERYRAIATEIDYPAPTRWTPDSHPRNDVVKPLLMTFDTSHLIAAAQSLRDSPPQERTTPFVAGVTAGL